LSLVGPRHVRENTAFSGGLLSLSAPSAANGARRQRGEPCSDRGRSDAHDEAPAAVTAGKGVCTDGRKRGRERRKEEAQRAPLH
jgi:hypothetical protein